MAPVLHEREPHGRWLAKNCVAFLRNSHIRLRRDFLEGEAESLGAALQVAGSDAAEVLEAAEHGLDPPAIFVASFVILDRALAVASAGDDRDGALFAQGSPDAVGIVATVGDHPLHADGFADQQVRAFHVRRVARCQDEAKRPSEDIDKRMDLGRPAATRDANGIGSRPPFSPPALRWALM